MEISGLYRDAWLEGSRGDGLSESEPPRMNSLTCLDFVLAREGGYVNDPKDRGGATNFGITQETYDAWTKVHKPVKGATRPEVEVIWLQETVGAAPDGNIGTKTLWALMAALQAIGISGVVDSYLAKRRSFYSQIIRNDPTQEKFRYGWENRMVALKKVVGQCPG